MHCMSNIEHRVEWGHAIVIDGFGSPLAQPEAGMQEVFAISVVYYMPSHLHASILAREGQLLSLSLSQKPQG